MQLGAVKYDHASGRILDTFSLWVHPKINKKYGPGAKKLLDLQYAKESEITAPEALEAFAQWCGDDRVFATWGPDDYSVLIENLNRWKIASVPVPEWYYDLQIALCSAMGTNAQLSLEHVVEYCGIPEVFDYHNALHDSLYTALVTNFVSEEELIAARRKPRFFGTPRDEIDEMPVGAVEHKRALGSPRGPFENPEQALNDRMNRKARCPYCGSTHVVEEWATLEGIKHYTDFRCREHGHFVLRLELTIGSDGAYHTAMAAMDPTAENKKRLKAARSGAIFHCRGAKRRRRRGRRRKKPTTPAE